MGMASGTLLTQPTAGGHGRGGGNIFQLQICVTSQAAEYSSHLFPSLPHEAQVYQRKQVRTSHDHDTLEDGFWLKGLGGGCAI